MSDDREKAGGGGAAGEGLPVDIFDLPWDSDGLDAWFPRPREFAPPACDEAGVMPPLRRDLFGERPAEGFGPLRELDKRVAPFRLSFDTFCEEFGTKTLARKKLLRRFLAYRASFHRFGFVRGWQWVHGSFITAKPDPGDVDMASFVVPPERWRHSTPASREAELVAHGDAFLRPIAKEKYGCDAYFHYLVFHPWTFRMITAFHTLFGHHHNHHWKGYVEIDLAPQPTEAAWIERLEREIAEAEAEAPAAAG